MESNITLVEIHGLQDVVGGPNNELKVMKIQNENVLQKFGEKNNPIYKLPNSVSVRTESMQKFYIAY